MDRFEYRYTAKIPEQTDISFSSTGSQGGDSGHGGQARLTFSMENGGVGFGVRFHTDNEATHLEEVRKIEISVMGDMELEGMATALIELGRSLLARDDVLEARAKWRSSS